MTAKTTARDHLRVCGADDRSRLSAIRRMGSSPRVRSGQPPHWRPRFPRGIISACAERTIAALQVADKTKDHLRVCGADPTVSVFDTVN